MLSTKYLTGLCSECPRVGQQIRIAERTTDKDNREGVPNIQATPLAAPSLSYCFALDEQLTNISDYALA